jgi:hypothetical protein
MVGGGVFRHLFRQVGFKGEASSNVGAGIGVRVHAAQRIQKLGATPCVVKGALSVRKGEAGSPARFIRLACSGLFTQP